MMEERSQSLQIMLQSSYFIKLCFDGLSVYFVFIWIVSFMVWLLWDVRRQWHMQ